MAVARQPDGNVVRTSRHAPRTPPTHTLSQPNATTKATVWNDTIQAKLASLSATWSPKLADLNATLAPKLSPLLAVLNVTVQPKLAALNASVQPKLAELNATLAPKAAAVAATLASAASAATAAHPGLAALNETLAAMDAVIKSTAATLKAKKHHGLCTPRPFSGGVAANNSAWTNFKPGGSTLLTDATNTPEWKIYVLTVPATLCGGVPGAVARLTTATAAFASNAVAAPPSSTADVWAGLFATVSGGAPNGDASPVGKPTAQSARVSVTIPQCVGCTPPPPSPSKPEYLFDLGPDFVVTPGSTVGFGLTSTWPVTNDFKWANVADAGVVDARVTGNSGFIVSTYAWAGTTSLLTSTLSNNNFLELGYACYTPCPVV